MDSKLFYGDNLAVLRESVGDETVDLVYLDPPFNSNASYNAFYRTPAGDQSEAQAHAFLDTWSWLDPASEAYETVMTEGGDLASIVRAFRSCLGESDLMAYLAMMAVRLSEMRRVLKPTGSLYLHCDPTASHYLKIILDGIFGADKFRNEIVWQRTSAHNDPTRYGRVHDTILFYSKEDSFCWEQQYDAADERYFSAHDFERDEDGRLYRKRDLTAPARGGSGQYEWKGKRPPKGRMWSYTEENMRKLEAEGRVVYTRTGMPRMKIYAETPKGVPLQDVWVRPELWLNAAAKERLGYPTQKPLALLERIIATSSRPGDVVLDPFCGCGTAIHAAEKLNRRWIGIDVTHIAVQIVEDRIRRHFPAAKFSVSGRPTDLAGAADLAERDKYQFQWWATWLVGGQPRGGMKKGADRGIDGEMFFKVDAKTDGKAIISVKGGQSVGPSMVRDLVGTCKTQAADMGIFICLVDPTQEMKKEAAAQGFWETTAGKFPRIQLRTIKQLLGGQKVAHPPLYNTVTASEEARIAARRKARPEPKRDRKQRHLMLPLHGGSTSDAPRGKTRQLPLDASAEPDTRRKPRSRAS